MHKQKNTVKFRKFLSMGNYLVVKVHNFMHLLSSIMRSVEEKNSQMSVKKKNGNHILITF